MRLLDRYLLRELLTPLAFCLVGIQSLIIFFTVTFDASKIEEAKLNFGESIEYATAASMGYLPYVIPVALLLALLMALTHHARYNELTAMRAAGISLWRICAPYFLVGLAASGILFLLNESIVPRSLDWAERAVNRNSQEASGPQNEVLNFGFINAPVHRTWIIRGYYRPGALEMPHPEVDWMPPDGSGFILDAARAVRTNGVWTFYDAKEYSQTNFVQQLETNVLAMPEFDETPPEIRNDYRIAGYLNIGAHTPNIPLHDIVTYLRWHPHLPGGDRSRLLTELHERIATPFTCLVVVLIAIPFGAAPGRRNLFFGVAGSIFICFTYFILQRVALAFGSSGELPPWLAAWLPNLFFAALGSRTAGSDDCNVIPFFHGGHFA
jgi:lipopolysaccharide export system permease protein